MFRKKADPNLIGVVTIVDKKDALKKIAEAILSAEKEIFINSNYYLKVFEEELKIVQEKGVRIIIFSFNSPEECSVKIEIYNKGLTRDDNYDRQVNMVVDHKCAILFDEKVNEKKVEAMYITNPRLVKMVGEHIHHDIYFQKIQYLIGGMDIISKVNIGTSYEVFKEK